ncbi:MAG: hypothetical protein KGM24_12435, partial [Elusimicrobia bacterium]|nr:hypothetical protein [Elusimicrobiota bacterium]
LTPAQQEHQREVGNCEEALNGSLLNVGRLCKYAGPIGVYGAPILAGILDAVKQQLGTAQGLIMNAAFMLLGLVFGLLSGGIGLLAKVLFAVGMSVWAWFSLLPQIKKLWHDWKNSAHGSVDAYRVIRQFAGLVGGVVIMALLAAVGGAVAGKVVPAAFEARLASLTEGIHVPFLSRLSEALKAPRATAPAEAPVRAEAASEAAEAPARTARARAVKAPDRGYVLAAEEHAPQGAAGRLSRVVEKTVSEQINKEIKPGERPTVEQAHRVITDAMEKAHRAVERNAARRPVEAASRVDLAVGIIAKDAHGEPVLVSAKAGGADVFMRRGGDLVRLHEAPVLDRAAAATDALAADGIAPLAELPLDAVRFDRSSDLLRTDPLVEDLLAEPGVDAAPVVEKPVSVAAEKPVAADGPAVDEPVVAAREPVPAEAAPAPDTALGSPAYRSPEVRELPVKQGDVALAAGREAAESLSGAHGDLPVDTPPEGYGRALRASDRLSGEDPAVADLPVEEKPVVEEPAAEKPAVETGWKARALNYGMNAMLALSGHYGTSPNIMPKIDFSAVDGNHGNNGDVVQPGVTPGSGSGVVPGDGRGNGPPDRHPVSPESRIARQTPPKTAPTPAPTNRVAANGSGAAPGAKAAA